MGRLWVLILGTCAACGSGGAPRETLSDVSRADSGGVEVVTTRRIEGLPRWTLDSTPTLSIGTVEGGGPDGFQVVSGALVLRDESVLVSDLRAGSVRQFDREGRFVRQLVREGQGPAELRYAGAPTRFGGDSIAILDGPLGRVVVFDEALQHAFTRPLQGYREGDSLFANWMTVISSTEAIGMLIRMGGRLPAGTTTRRKLTVGRIPFDGSAFLPIASGQGSALYGLQGGMGTGLPLATETVFAVGKHSIYLGESEAPAVGVWRFDGRLVRRVRWEAPPDPTTPDDKQRAFARDSAMWTDAPEIKRTKPDFQRRILTEMKTLPVPAHMPYFTRLAPADDGGLWIERRPRPWLESAEFLVADSTGALVARIAVPSELSILQVGPDWVLGRWRTEDDVHLVRRYRIVR